MKQPKVLAWHFTDGMILRDGQPLKVGKVYKHTGPLVMCEAGYHASIDIRDALPYAPGFTVSCVQCSGEMKQQSDKLVCRERKALWSFDAKEVILKWSIRVATDAIKTAKKVYPNKAWNAWADLWISGEDRSCSAAYSAACSAAYSAACSAANSAAYSAANAAASAAYSAANNAASAANAARKTYSGWLVAMIEKAREA